MSIILDTSQKSKQGTWIELDIDRLHANVKTLQDSAGYDSKILAVVKANAYGHGLVKVSRELEGRVAYLGVSSVQEALELKEHNIKTPIFLFGQLLPSELPCMIGQGVTLSVSSLDQARSISELSKKKDVETSIHIKVDTGMGRLGIPFRYAIKHIEEMVELPSLKLEGIYTHFPTAEKEDGFTEKQMQDFSLLIQALEKKDIRFTFRHAANSSACVRFREANFNLVRPGLMLYGLYPHPSLKVMANVQPVLSLKSRIIMVKRLVPGESVGYGRDFIAEKHTNIATLPVGYSHGYPFRSSRHGSVILNGRIYPLAGRVSMDYLCINLGEDWASVGDEVTLIGEDQNESISAEDIADWAGTIPYEVITGLNYRIPRLYTHDQK